METITPTMKRATLSEHYAEIRKRLGDRRTPARPIIPIDRIKPMASDQDTPPAIVPIAPPESKLPLPRVKPGIEIIKLQPRQSKLILETVAEKYKMTVDELKNKSRKRRFVEAREEAFYRLREAGYSWPQCARFCGRMDHTTAINGAQNYEKRINDKVQKI